MALQRGEGYPKRPPPTRRGGVRVRVRVRVRVKIGVRTGVRVRVRVRVWVRVRVTCRHDEGIDLAARLPPDLSSRAALVRAHVGEVLELVGVWAGARAEAFELGAEHSHARAGEARRGLSQSERRELARFEASSVRTLVVFSFPRF